MSQLTDFLLSIVKSHDNSTTQFINLVEILAKKGLLTIEEVEYIRKHGVNEDVK